MRAGVLVVLALTAASSAAGVASADRGNLRDARGDAQAPWDILSIAVDNGSRSLRIKMAYRGRLRPAHTSQGLLANIGIDTGAPARSIYGADFTIDMLRGSTTTPNRLHLVRGYKRASCPGLRLRVRSQPGLLSFVVPQRCLGTSAGRVRVTGHTYSPRGAADEADYLERWGGWIARD